MIRNKAERGYLAGIGSREAGEIVLDSVLICGG